MAVGNGLVMSDEPAKVIPIRALRPCPECKHQSSREHYPFCSRRCREVDLNRWLSGAYVIPAKDSEDDEPLSLNERDDS